MNLFDIFESNEQELDEDLRKWFKDKWVRFGPDGEIRGDCARGDDSEGKPKCLPQSKAQSLGKKGRASAAARKRREDPNPERSGKAINVATKKKSNEGVAEGYNDLGPEYGGAYVNGRSDDAKMTARLTRQAKAAAAKAGKTFGTSAEYRKWHARQKEKEGVAEAINPDITNPEFSHQQQIGDYLYVARYWSKGLKITAYHGNKQIGYAELMYQSAPFDDFADPKTTPKRIWLESEWTRVDPKYQRQGIMSTMYAYAKMLGNSVKPSQTRSDDAKAAWKSWRQSGDAKHLTSESDDPWGPQGNFAGDKHVDVGGVTMKIIQVGDMVKYLGQKAEVVALSKDRKRARITIQKDMGSITKDVNTSDLNQFGQGVEEGGGMPFRGVGGAFNRGDDERHDLDPTDWYFVKDGKMFAVSVYPNQEQEAISRGYSRTRDEAKAKAGQQGVAEAFGPLPRDSQQIRLGRHTVDIERVGIDKNYISFTWNDSQGQEHYEEVSVGDLGSYDDLIDRIKDEIRYQERQYTDQGVAEGSLNELSKDTLKSYAKKAVPDMQSSQNKSKAEYSKAASAKDDETANKHYDAAKQAKDRTEKRMAGVAGAIKRFNKEGVAEGSNDTIYPNAEVIKSKNGRPVGEIYQDGNSWGCFHYRADRGYDMIDTREDAIEALKDLHQETGRSRPDYTIKGVAEEQLDEKCWDTHKQVGMKKKGNRMVPNCVPKESIEEMAGKTNPDAVRRIQQLLNNKFDANLDIDGILGPLTLKSIKKFLPKSTEKQAPNPEKTTAVQGKQVKEEKCPHCGGEMVSEELINEKKDSCYYKVKSRYKVWPSAYASGALVKCRKKGAKNWGNKSEGVAEGLNEMDKTQTPPGRDGDIDWTKKQIHLGPEHTMKAKDVAKHALKILNKTMKKSHADTPKKKGVAEDQLDEKWSQKYKDSINCSNPKGFSQKAHCAGEKKNEDMAEGKEYYTVTGTDSVSLRRDFNMAKDRNGWYLKEGATPKQKLEAFRAFGSPKLKEFNLAAFSGGTQTKGEDNVISPVGSQTRAQYKK